MHPAIARHLVYLPVQRLRGLSLPSAMKELAATETYSIERIREYQLKKARLLLEESYRYVPFYRQKLKALGLVPDDIREVDDWSKLPLLSKDEIVARHAELLSERRPWRVTTKTTGGSTGRAVTVEKDPRALSYEDAAMWRGLGWNGIHAGDRQARFWGVPIRRADRAKYVLIDRLMNRIRFSAFDISDRAVGAFHAAVVRFRPHYFYGYTSLIVAFAEYVNSGRLEHSCPSPRLIVTTSEPLYQPQRELLQSVFGCRVIQDYGCGELGPIAYECEQGGFHLFANTLLVEVLHGTRAARPGEPGELVITDLHNYRMPLIRYQIKDYGVLSDRRCHCGRTLPLLERVVGRVLDTIALPNGTRIHGEYFNYIAEEMKKRALGLKQLQVIQTGPGRLVVKIVRDGAFSDASMAFLTNQLRNRITADVAVDYEFAEEIPRAASGKMRLVISEYTRSS